jgi:hypothetical protein
VAFYVPEDPPQEQQELYKQSPFFDKTTYEELQWWPFCWHTEKWRVSTNDLILDFELNRGSPTCNGIWRVQDIISGGAIVPVEKVPRPFGLAFPKSEQQALASLSQAYIADHGLPGETGLINGADFARAIAKKHRAGRV